LLLSGKRKDSQSEDKLQQLWLQALKSIQAVLWNVEMKKEVSILLLVLYSALAQQYAFILLHLCTFLIGTGLRPEKASAQVPFFDIMLMVTMK
jgi:hypothetical protein